MLRSLTRCPSRGACASVPRAMLMHQTALYHTLLQSRSYSQLSLCSHHAFIRSLSSLSPRPSTITHATNDGDNDNDANAPLPSETSYLDGRRLPSSSSETRALIDRIRPHLYVALSRANINLHSGVSVMNEGEVDVACASVLELVRLQQRSITSDELVRLTVKQIERQIHEAEVASAIIDKMTQQSFKGLPASTQTNTSNDRKGSEERIEAMEDENSNGASSSDQAAKHILRVPSHAQRPRATNGTGTDAATASKPSHPATAKPKPSSSTDTASPTAASFRLYSEQLQLETLALNEAVKGYASVTNMLVNMQKGAALRPAQRMMISWYNPLVSQIESEQERAREYKQKNKKLCSETQHLPLLLSLGAPQLAVLTMHTMFSLALQREKDLDGVKFAHAALQVGSAVNMQVRMEAMRKDKTKLRQFMTSVIDSHNGRASSTMSKLNSARGERWTQDLCIKLGAALLFQLIATAAVPSHHHKRGSNNNSDASTEIEPNAPFVPAFKHVVVLDTSSMVRGVKKVGMVITDERVLNTVLRDSDVAETMTPKLKPMLVKPRPWTSFDSGGYLSVQSKVMRSTGSHLQQLAVSKCELKSIYDGLNYLSAVPWSINGPVLSVVEELWEGGGGCGELPSRQDLVLPAIDKSLAKSSDAYKQQQREYNVIDRKNRNLHSLRCDTELKLNVARQFRGRTIYFPFNLDFRGRAYPIPPHLNHIGNDLSRGLLTFKDRRALGAVGVQWLKIHAANLWGQGKEKLPFDERVKWTEENFALITQAAVDPLNKQSLSQSLPESLLSSQAPNHWWLQAEKPFQFLATCFELHAAHQLDNPELYLSSLPVHQDGSCNGLQHYAALGRDTEGGEAVNLTPTDRPQDVYSVVCARVNQRLHEDAIANTNELAQFLAGRVVRKVVKQTVMTSVYGVTLIGARDQIKARLLERQDIPWPEDANVEEMCHHSALYLAKLTLESLYSAFSGARRIQDWLTDAAHSMASIQQPVSWITPLGLPVIQPYRRTVYHEVNTVMQSVTIADHNDNLPVSSMRQRSAFPPNFIHSLDATHMLLTAIRCRDAKMTYTAVHDSYWTHAGSMPDMNRILREEFVNLYSQPILERLRHDWQQRFPELEFAPVPETGELDLQRVLDSPYFFN